MDLSTSIRNSSVHTYLRAMAVIATAFTVFATACSKPSKDTNPHSTRLARAQALVDEGRSDEAIELIHAALDEISRAPQTKTAGQDPGVMSIQEERYRAVLASAHLMKAELPAHKFYRFARTFSDADSLSEERFSFFGGSSSKSKGEPTTAVEIFEAHGLQAFAIFLQVKSRYEAIPEIDEAQDRELSLALEALQPISTPSSGVALYRSLIKTVRFKRFLQTDFLRRAAPVVSHSGRGECKVGKIEFFDTLKVTLESATDIARDLKFSFPEREDEISKALTSLGEASLKLEELRVKIVGETGAEREAFAASELIRFVRLHLGWEWLCE